MNVNHAAFGTTTALAVATISSTVSAAAATAGTVAMVAYTILAITSAAVSLAAISAWVSTKDEDMQEFGKYFSTMTSHAGVAIAGLFQFAAQVLVQSLIRGASEGVGTNIRRKIAGPDLIYSQV